MGGCCRHHYPPIWLKRSENECGNHTSHPAAVAPGMSREQSGRHGRNLQENESCDNAHHEQPRHKVNQPCGVIDVHGSAGQIRDEKVADDAHSCCRNHFVKLESNKCLEPTPEQEVSLIKNHPRNEYWTKQSNNRCSDCAVGDDDGDECGQNSENHLHGI